MGKITFSAAEAIKVFLYARGILVKLFPARGTSHQFACENATGSASGDIGTAAFSRTIAAFAGWPCCEGFPAFLTYFFHLARCLFFRPRGFECVAALLRARSSSAMIAVNGKLLAAHLAHLDQIALGILLSIGSKLAFTRAVFGPLNRIRGKNPGHVSLAALLTRLFNFHACILKQASRRFGLLLLSRQHSNQRDARISSIISPISVLPRHRTVYTRMTRMSRMRLGA